MTRARPLLLDLAWALLTCGALMAAILAGGGIWKGAPGQDLHGYFLPRYEEAGRALLHEGRLPLWNPNEFAGAPLFAAIQSSTVYPPVPLLFGTLAPWTALQLLYAFHLLLLGCGMIFYLRAHGVPRAFAAGAIVVTVAGVFTGPGQLGIDHPNFLGSVAWIPWLLICFERALVRPRPWLALLAIAYAFQWLAGYPDFGLDTAVLLGVIALLQGGAPLPRRVLVVVGGLALGVLLVAFQLLPAWESIGESVRALNEASYVEFRQAFAMPFPEAITVAVIERFGVAVLLIAAAGLVVRPTRVQLAWLAAFVWCTFALHWPFELLYRLPVFRGIRIPCGWGHIGPLFLGLLAALGAARWWEDRRVVVRAIVVVVAVWAAGFSGAIVVNLPATYSDAPDHDAMAERAAVLQRVQRSLGQPARFVSMPEINGGGMVRYDLPSIMGYDPSSPLRRNARMLKEADRRQELWPGGGSKLARRPGLAAMMGVGVVTAPQRWSASLQRKGFMQVATLPPDDVVLYREPVPRARLVHSVAAAADEETSYAWTVDPRRDVRASAVVEAPPVPVEVRQPPPGAAESARIVVDQPERVAIDVVAAAPALLVLTDTFYPGWQATVDGAPVPVLRADYLFRGVSLPPGTHRVVFTFDPPLLWIGGLVSLVAALVVALLLSPWRRGDDASRLLSRPRA
jgi:hypothetical protein